ncbi:MAG: HipA N-terminal domain-containing protein [Gemmatimonadaceae bacterium]
MCTFVNILRLLTNVNNTLVLMNVNNPPCPVRSTPQHSAPSYAKNAKPQDSLRPRPVIQYEPELRAQPGAFPLSLSMPLSKTEHGHSATSAFLWGLLPTTRACLNSGRDNAAFRARMSWGCSRTWRRLRRRSTNQHSRTTAQHSWRAKREGSAHGIGSTDENHRQSVALVGHCPA